jgi:DNA primase
MGFGRDDSRGNLLSEEYTEEQIGAVLNKCKIEISDETYNDFIVFCPFHGNKHTPSMSVSKHNGMYICFNGSCAATGDLKHLVSSVMRTNPFETARIIITAKSESEVPFLERLQKVLDPPQMVPFPQETLDRMINDFWNSERAINYMVKERRFEESTLRKFKIGYSAKKDLISVPMFDEKGTPVGVVGRGITEKKFKNSRQLPTSKTLWNIHNAKRTGDTVIVQEASFDGMKTDQAGYENVVACLGGNFSEYHKQQLDRYFSTIIIMTDFDDSQAHRYEGCRKCFRKGHNSCIGHNPGRALGEKIATELAHKRILWASYENGIVYPESVYKPGQMCKDADDMSPEQLRQTVKNAVTNYEYRSWPVASTGLL